jgi:hypothetical protein
VMVCVATFSLAKLASLGGIFLLGMSAGYCFCITRSVVPCILLHGLSSGATYLVSGMGKLLYMNE